MAEDFSIAVILSMMLARSRPLCLLRTHHVVEAIIPSALQTMPTLAACAACTWLLYEEVCDLHADLMLT